MHRNITNRLILVLIMALAIVLVFAGCGAFGKELDAPTLTFNGDKGIVNWDAVQNAKGYVVRSNNEVFEVGEPNYKLPGRGKYLIDVKSMPENSAKYKPSKYTRIEVAYTSKISTPNVAITRYIGGDVKYIIDNFDEYAEKYVININGVAYDVHKDRGIIDANLSDDTYDVTVMGVGDNIYTRDSDVRNVSVTIEPVKVSEVSYETMDTQNDLVVGLQLSGSIPLKVDGNLYELDPKDFRYSERSNKLTIDEHVLLSYAGREPLVFDVHYVDGNIEVIKVNIIDHRKPYFGESNFVTVYSSSDAIIPFDIYRYDLAKVEMLKMDGSRVPIEADKGYEISYHLLSATAIVNTPQKDIDRGVIFTLTKDSDTIEQTIEFYYQDSLPHVTSSHTTYNVAKSNGDLNIAFDGGNNVTSVKLKNATQGVDYIIDNDNNKIVIKRSYLDKFSRGTVLTGRAYFGGEYGTFTIHVINDKRVEVNAFKKSEYQFLSGSNADLILETSNVLTNSTLRAISLDGVIFNNNYIISGNTLTLKGAYLNTLPYGFHELRLHMTGSDNTNSYDSVTTIHILQPENNVPLGVNVTIDNTYPYIAVNYVGTTKDTTTYLTNINTSKTYYAKSGENRVLVPYNEIDKGDKFTLSHTRAGKTGTTSAITYDGFNLNGYEKYYNAKFTFGGNEYDGVMTNENEFETFVHYGLMRVSKMRAYDAVGRETDANDTMPWTSSSRTGFEYAVRVYLPFVDVTATSEVSKLVKEASNTYKEPTKGDIVSIEMGGTGVWEINFKVLSTNVPYNVDKEGHEPEAVRYNYSYELPYATKKPRSSAYDNFKINTWTKTQSVYLTDELYYAIEDGARPIPVAGSPADKMYDKIKTVMRNIVDDSMSDHEKYLAILDFINHNVVYDDMTAAYERRLNTTNYHLVYPRRCFYLEGVFDDGIAVCNGLAKAVTVMAGIEGINSMKVMGNVGTSRRDPRHAWNKVYLDGIWYNSDPTWSSQKLGEPVVNNLIPEGINHREALLSDKMFNPNNVHNPDARFKDVYANINFDYFANIILGRDTDGNINTLNIQRISDIDAIFNSVKDEVVAITKAMNESRTRIDIPFVLINSDIDVATELVNRFKGVDPRWSVEKTRGVSGKYYYKTAYTLITLKFNI